MFLLWLAFLVANTLILINIGIFIIFLCYLVLSFFVQYLSLSGNSNDMLPCDRTLCKMKIFGWRQHELDVPNLIYCSQEELKLFSCSLLHI